MVWVLFVLRVYDGVACNLWRTWDRYELGVLWATAMVSTHHCCRGQLEGRFRDPSNCVSYRNHALSGLRLI